MRTDEKNDIRILAFSPDGRILALGMWDKTILLWDAFTGQDIRRMHGHQDAVFALAFSPDGRKLASGCRDGTGLIWDLTDEISAKPLSAEEVRVLWDDLDSKDAVRAERAFWTLAAAPREAIPLLREQFKTDRIIAIPNLGRLIADLDADRFALREKAERELARLGVRTELSLRRALDEKPSLEARRRIERLLARLAEKPSDIGPLSVRELRAVRVLEQIGTREAREMLERLARGSADSALAKEADAALHRCQRRK